MYVAQICVWEGQKNSVCGASPSLSLCQESWYEFRVMAVMDDLISESSNVVGVSSTGQFLHSKVWQSTHRNEE